MLLRHLSKGRKRQRQGERQRDPDADHRQATAPQDRLASHIALTPAKVQLCDASPTPGVSDLCGHDLIAGT